MAQIREGALRAGGAVADFAARTDRHDRLGAGEIDADGVDQLRGVGHIAAEPDRKALVRAEIAARLRGGGPGNLEIGAFVGHLSDLRQELAGAGKGVMNHP